MVGLPFPHAGDAELKEKMKFLDRKYGCSANAGRQYYEDLCMKAVNQSIGRAEDIRMMPQSYCWINGIRENPFKTNFQNG